MKRYKISNEELFVLNSSTGRRHIKQRLLDEKLIPYVCAECGNKGLHNDKVLVLQLEHKNGIASDNRLINLCFLCPNCHSQTDTYAGKSTKGKRCIRVEKTKYSALKKEYDQKIWNELKNDPDIRYGEWGWKTRLCHKLGISSQKVRPWLLRIDPEFLFSIENKC